MVRMNELPERQRKLWSEMEMPTVDNPAWVSGPPLSERRIAFISSAGLHRQDDTPFFYGSDDYRAISSDTPANEVLMSHISANFDRAGFQEDINIAYPIDRLKELAADGVIGSVADTHYSFMGATAPAAMEPKAHELAELLKQDNVDSVLLAGV